MDRAMDADEPLAGETPWSWRRRLPQRPSSNLAFLLSSAPYDGGRARSRMVPTF
jgi:hypothetical protein